MEEKLPKYTKNQQVGNRSATILKSVMQNFCIFTELDQSQDFGIDFIGTVFRNGFPTEYNFNAQCKGTIDIEIKLNSCGTNFSYPVEVKTINYWKQKKDVTFLFLVDEKKGQAYWTAPLTEIENKDISGQDSYTFHISVDNCINSNTSTPPELFIFEIIRYYANFSDNIIRQFDKIQEYSTDISGRDNMIKLMETLEKNFNKVEKKYRETINNLIKKIKFDLERSLGYCFNLDQMDDIVRIYCPLGIFDTPFGTGEGVKTIKECRGKIENLISQDDITYKELFDLSKEVSELRGNLLGFFLEMAYENMPLANHGAIEKEFMEWLKETGR